MNNTFYDRHITPKTILKGGEIFQLDTGFYILTRTPNEELKRHFFNLHSLDDGNAWSDAIIIGFNQDLYLDDVLSTMDWEDEVEVIGFVDMSFTKIDK